MISLLFILFMSPLTLWKDREVLYWKSFKLSDIDQTLSNIVNAKVNIIANSVGLLPKIYQRSRIIPTINEIQNRMFSIWLFFIFIRIM